jgi:hypothetical protein
MRTLKSLAMATAVASLVSVLGTMGYGVPPTPGTSSGTKLDTFSVIQIVGASGVDDIRVVAAAELDELRKTILDEDKTAAKAYQDAKKAAGKDATDLQKPTKRTIKILHAGFKSADDAEDWKAKNPPGAPKGTKGAKKKQ